MLAFTAPLHAQYPGWQQEMDCTMDITMDVDVHQYSGVMDLTYINHSPDVLERIPFHLFFNAFQPGSMMDVRSRNIADPDPRVGDRIVQLPEEEWGWIRVREARVGKTDATFTTDGTIGWLDLPKALAPGKKVRLHLEWDAQVPRQIRRSGWMNKQGVEYSMTQWYPRLCEYDHHGWHTNPYIGREFHGVWGDYDVTIHMPAAYMIGGTGVLQNPEDCGHGYSDSATPTKGMIDWHFVAEDVIDFAWAADPDFVHKTLQMEDGPLLHFIHQADTSYGAWDELPAIAARAMQFYSDHVGTYPWPQYTVIEGGDGGMEYPMCTLVRGNRNLRSLVGVTAHEMAHAWFQGLLATNESLHEWMDEGFTSWIESEFLAEEFNESRDQPHYWAYGGYLNLVRDGGEEPLSTHADHYVTNRAYGTGAYSKGEVLMNQLAAVIGREARDAGIKRYFDEWAFKHPGPVDFKRVMERESGLGTRHLLPVHAQLHPPRGCGHHRCPHHGGQHLHRPRAHRQAAPPCRPAHHHRGRSGDGPPHPAGRDARAPPSGRRRGRSSRLALDAPDLHGGLGRVHTGQHLRNRRRRLDGGRRPEEQHRHVRIRAAAGVAWSRLGPLIATPTLCWSTDSTPRNQVARATALGMALMLALLGPIVIDLEQGLPLSLQSLLVCWLPLMFGWRAGVTGVLAYILAGCLGLPVFAGHRAGIDVIGRTDWRLPDGHARCRSRARHHGHFIPDGGHRPPALHPHRTGHADRPRRHPRARHSMATEI